jgi:hypothetical protein
MSGRGSAWDVEQVLPFGGGYGQLLAGPVVVSTFDDKAAAEEECARREGQARRGVNPFRYSQNNLAVLTSLDPAVFPDWLLDAGIEPPCGDSPDWEAWFDRSESGWDGAQRERFWQGLDRLRFFRVVERPARRKAYLVLEVGWNWCDEPPYYTDPQSRRPVEAFSNRRDAERRRRELEGRRRAEGRPGMEFEWSAGGTGRTGNLAEAPLFEVVEVDWESPP